MSDRKKIFDLLYTGEESNIELAWSLDQACFGGKIKSHLKKQLVDLMYYARVDSLTQLYCLNILSFSYRENLNINMIIPHLPKVTHLMMQSCKPNQFPKNITHLRNLTTISMNGSGYTEIPQQIKLLKKLRYLDLDSNNIEYIPEWLFEMQSIKYLNFFDNKLKKIPKNITNLKNLKNIVLMCNRINPKDVKNLDKKMKNCRIDF